MAEIRMAPDAERVLRDAERLCFETNIAIGAPEHLLAAALTIVAAQGEVSGLPDADTLRAAAITVHGTAERASKSTVMWGSAARETLAEAVRLVREAGETDITARRLALAIVRSGEVNPFFFSAAGMSKDELRRLLAE